MSPAAPGVLDAIHDIAAKALLFDDPGEKDEALELIVSMARYNQLVWTDEEQARYKSQD